jgi:hypothetical protein
VEVRIKALAAKEEIVTADYLFLGFFAVGVVGALSSSLYGASKAVACSLALVPPVGLLVTIAYC